MKDFIGKYGFPIKQTEKMNGSETILNLKTGETITITDINSGPVEFYVNVGDAMLNGDKSQVWLANDDTNKRIYLRRRPEKDMSIGLALFSSLSDLAQTLETGDYYIG